MYFLNEKEEKVIGKFLNSTDDIQGKELNLIWDYGSQAHALYDSYIEDESDFEIDEDGYEEFWSFVFKVITVDTNTPIEITEDNYSLINYRNFPKEIIVNGKKIN
ncbi:MAG: hypothetical protein IKW62_02870 [Clostridia bacterium]|nr:hypothetical protein [Clostridia bacterium]